MSKSIGNVVEAYALKDRYGNDAFRYFVMREMAFGLDADFTEEAFVARLNAELANDLGNLVSRATTLVVNFGGGRVQPPDDMNGYWLATQEPDLKAGFERCRAAVEAAMEEFAFHRALAAIWEFVGAVNRFVDVLQPWTLAKDPARRAHLEAVLWALGESLRGLGILLSPFVPDAAARIRGAVGQTGEPKLANATWGRLAAGATVARVSGLFPRVDDRTKPAAAEHAATGPAAAKERIPKDEFARVELRVAEVVAAEAVPKSKKLLKLTVSLGAEQRTVVAGIAEHYAPGDLVGKKIVIVANLEPAKLMGVESQGMILAGSADGSLAVLTVDRDLPPGAKVS
jgi:methionyl-tRNA synthetase